MQEIDSRTHARRQNTLRQIPIPFLMLTTIVVIALGVLLFALLYNGGGANVLAQSTLNSNLSSTNAFSPHTTTTSDSIEPDETLIGPTPSPSPAPEPVVSNEGRLIPYYENMMWGYKNKLGEAVLPAQFIGDSDNKGAFEFQNDVAFAMYSGLYGLINRDGGWIVAPTWSDVRAFSEDKAAVCSAGRWGYINYAGELVIDYSFVQAGDFHCGRAIFRNDQYYGYIDINGIVVISPKWSTANDFSNDVAFATSQSGNNYIIDKLGEKIATLGSHASGTIYSEDFAVIKDGSSYYYYNSYAKSAFKTTYDDALAFNGGLAAVKLEGLWGFIDTRGVLVIPNQFTNVHSFSNGYAAVLDNNTNLWGYIDVEGFMTLSPQFDEAGDFDDGVAVVRIGNTYYIIKSSGERVLLY